MLYAVLHGKLSEATPLPERLEDSLTSTVFGTLVCVEAWDVLARWLGVAPFLDPAGPRQTDCWFWPRMAFAEPDVVLRFDDVLVVVEAKYRSGRHDLPAGPDGEVDEEANARDQLLRQYRSVKAAPETRVRYIEDLEFAILERHHFVQTFIVDSRRRSARDEFEESTRLLPGDADLRLVAWQHLYRILNQIPPARWTKDLRAYLERLSLDTFEGIGRQIPGEEAQNVLGWRMSRPVEAFQFVIDDVSHVVEPLRNWPAPAHKGRPTGSLVFPREIVDGSVSRVIHAWRPLVKENR